MLAAEVRAELLAGSRLFAGLADRARREVAAAGREVRVRRKQAFFAQGDTPCALHLLLAGQVALRQASPDGAEITVRLIAPGQAFSMAAVLENEGYPATAEALKASHALVWDGAQVRSFLDRYPPFARAAVDVLLERVRDLEERFRELATQRVGQRLARALVRLTRHAGRRTPEGVLIDLPLSREELARMTGTTLFTVSRTLSEWEQRGVVEVGRERVLVRYPHGLVAIAEDLPESREPEP
jgi:CRP/FNR family transcriptional regulator, nitrogen oxide reductase regulator